MDWSILMSILIFLILLHLLRNTYVKEDSYSYTSKNVEDKRIPLKLWGIILIFIGSFIPVINIILFFTVPVCIYLFSIDEVYYKMPNKGIFKLLRKIGRFLNKDI